MLLGRNALKQGIFVLAIKEVSVMLIIVGGNNS
jgi:hypothetical protein